MSVDVKLPELGENIKSADVLKVLVSANDRIKKDQSLIEIETEKATVEVPSTVAGIIQKVLVKKGDKIEVGRVIVTVNEAAAGEALNDKSDSFRSSTPAPALVGGSQQAIRSKEEPQNQKEEFSARTGPQLPSDEKNVARSVPASPSVRRFAREIGVDIAYVSGTGPRGHITMDDVKAYVRKLQHGPSGAEAVLSHAPALPDLSRWGPVEYQPMTNVRRKTAEHTSLAWTTIPHVTQFDRADITDLERLRKEHGKKVEQAGGKLTLTAILFKVVASALKTFPQFNTSVSIPTGQIVYKKYIHIGVAVDTDWGLLVPVLRNVDQKNILHLAVELTQVAEKARNRKLSIDEMQGGCFTITNLGGIGGTSFTPIINAPEVAILGVSRGCVEPVWVDQQFVPRTILPLSLSYDHRVIDGADAARFLRWIANALEQPFLVFLEG